MLGCANVSSSAECDQYNGAYAPGQTCVATGEADRALGVYGRCDGLGPFDAVVTDLSASSYAVTPSSGGPGSGVSYAIRVVNDGTGPAPFEVTETLPSEIVLDAASIHETQGEVRVERQDDSTLVVWTGCVRPFGGEASLTHAGTLAPDVAVGTTVTSHVALVNVGVGTRDASASVVVEPPPEPTHHIWEFTITPTGVSMVSVPLPEAIADGLRALGAERLVLLGGELPPFLAMGETNWTVSGMVVNPGFLPFLTLLTSTATYAAVTGVDRTAATLAVTVNVTEAPSGGLPGLPGLPGGGEKPDRDFDTVPDAIDACPDVPGDPADPVFPGCPKTGEDDGYYDEEPDADGDGIPDTYDLCPHEPGPWNEDAPGCPG